MQHAAHHTPTHQPHPAAAAARETGVVQRLNIPIIRIQILPTTTTTTTSLASPHALSSSHATPRKAAATTSSLKLETTTATAPWETACSNSKHQRQQLLGIHDFTEEKRLQLPS
jgi:hypothetical protein